MLKDASDSISSENKPAIESALNGFTAGQYLDISLYKIIGENRNAILETNKKIAITIAIPDSLKNTDSKITRTFAVIRIHNNQAEILYDADNNSDTITIETDRFSAYAIIYKDSADDNTNYADNGNKNPAGNGTNYADNGNKNPADGGTNYTNTVKQASIPETGDPASLELYATLTMIAGLALFILLVYYHRFGKKTL